VTVTGSYEALESAVITISGGDLDLTASDDGINVAGGTDSSGQQGAGSRTDSFSTSGSYRLTISGGTTVVDADGDGLDSGGTITMTGGTVVVSGPEQDGNGALDADGTISVSGGVLLAAGSSGMAQAPSTDSAQGWVAATIDTQAAGTTVQVVSTDGEVLASYTVEKEFSSLVYSSADVQGGAGYTVTAGGSATGEEVGGLASDGDASGATTLATATAGEFAGGGMGGGGMGGGGRPDN